MTTIFDKFEQGAAELVRYNAQLGAYDYSHLSASIALSTPMLLRYIGTDTWAQLLAHYASADYQLPEPSPEQIAAFGPLDTAVHHAQGYLANMAMKRNIARDNVMYTNAGIRVLWSDEQRPATQQQLDELKKSIYEDAHGYLSMLLEHMAAYPDIFSAFAAETATRTKGLIVPDLYTYEQYVSLQGKQSKYFHAIPALHSIQSTEVANVFGGDASEAYAHFVHYAATGEELDTGIQYSRVLSACRSGLCYLAQGHELRNIMDELQLNDDSRTRAILANAEDYTRRGRADLGYATTMYQSMLALVQLVEQPEPETDETDALDYFGSQNSIML